MQDIIVLGLNPTLYRCSEGVVCAVQHVLCLAHGIDLASACLGAHVVVLEEPVALGVHLAEVLLGLHQLSVGVTESALVGHHLLVGLRQRSLGIAHGLAVIGTLGLGIAHELLVVALGVLLLELHHLILLLDVVDEGVDHGDHAGRLLALGLVRQVCLRRRRR